MIYVCIWYSNLIQYKYAHHVFSVPATVNSPNAFAVFDIVYRPYTMQ